MPTALVTGATRGLGLEYARQLAGAGWRVIATARSAGAGELDTLAARSAGRVQVLQAELSDERAVTGLLGALGDTPLDLLVNNAGTFGPVGAPAGMAYQGLESMDYGIWRQILEVNVLAPFRLTVGLRANLLAGARRTIVMMSSDLGSIAQNQQGGAYAYRSSKAALNMITRGLSAEWRECIVVAMAPGWCRTRLGGAAAPVDPAESVRAQLAVIGGLTLADTGKFLNRFGEVVPW